VLKFLCFLVIKVDVPTATFKGKFEQIIDVVYNASNNELVRTKTLVKNCVITIDATPFKQWYLKHYNLELG
jgi:ribosomal protein S8E